LTLPVREVLPATPRTRIVRLDLNGHSFPYRPGQAVFVAMHGQPRRLAYSLAGAPEDATCDGCLELLVRVDQVGSSDSPLPVIPGERLDVDGPIGEFTFPVDPSERRFVFIAGGAGIAPLRAMLRHALAIPHREILVLYSARTPDEFAYQDELRELARAGRIELRQTITRDSDAEGWDGGRGRIGRTELQPHVQNPATLFFICGPRELVHHTKTSLEQLGVDRPRIRIEEW
jgi:ferredoxin-NADP reductase